MITSGSLVVCVDDIFPVYASKWAKDLPRMGNVYTVKDVGEGREPVTGRKDVSLILFELDNPVATNQEMSQVRFAIWRFQEYFVDLDEENNEFEEWLIKGIGQLATGFCEQ